MKIDNKTYCKLFQSLYTEAALRAPMLETTSIWKEKQKPKEKQLNKKAFKMDKIKWGP